MQAASWQLLLRILQILSLIALLGSGAAFAGAASAKSFNTKAASGPLRRAAIVSPLLQAQMARLLNRSRGRFNEQLAGPEITVIVRSHHDVSRAIEQLGGTLVADIRGKVIATRLPLSKVSDLAGTTSVSRLDADQRLHPALDQSIAEIGAAQAWSHTDSSGVPLKGSHVLVGIVDSGIDYHNPDFKNPDGSTRIKFIWDQSLDGQAPNGFDFGYECDAASINDGSCPEKDTDGHGTQVTGIAAGNGAATGGRESGVAPKADIIMVKSSLKTSDVMAAWQYLLDKSSQLNEPIAINNSFGGMMSPHNGSSDLDLAADDLAGPGHIFVASAGNSGHAGLHADGTLRQGATANVGVDFTGRDSTLTMGIYYHSVDTVSITLHNLDSGQSYGPISTGGQIDNLSSHDDIQVTLLSGKWDNTTSEVDVLVQTKSGKPLTGRYGVELQGAKIADAGRYDAWIDETISAFFRSPDLADSIAEPADSNSILAVGNYVTQLTWVDKNGATHTYCDFYYCGPSGSLQVGQIAASSSTGPTADGRQKPDISAPGTMILSSLSSDAPVCASPDDTDCLDPLLIASDGASLADTGTSMSAPHVTGVAALMLQANPTLDQQEATSILRSTARHDSFTGTAAWSPNYGAGKLDAAAAVESALGTPLQATATPRPTVAPLPTSTPTPTATSVPVTASFNITGVRIQAINRDKSPAVSRAKAGSQLYLFIYWRIAGMPDNAKPVYSYVATRSGKKALHATFTGTKPTYPPGTYWAVFPVKPKKAGTFVFKASVAVGSVSRTGSATLLVRK
jgi:minor extracellular serine protease Vpr